MKKIRLTKKICFLLSGTVVLSAIFLLLASAAAPLQAELQVLEAAAAEVTIVEQGVCLFETSMEVIAPLDAQVREVLVTEGQRVRKGDPIAVLYAADVEFQIQRLQSDIDAYNAQIGNLSLSRQKEMEVLRGSQGELAGQLSSVQAQIEGRGAAESTRVAQISLQEDIVAQDRANVRLARQTLRSYRDDYGSDSGDPEYNQYRQELNTAEKNLAVSEQALLDLQNSTIADGYYEGQQESLSAQIASIDAQLAGNYNAGLQSYYASLIESTRISIRELEEQQGRATVAAPCSGVISALPAERIQNATQGALLAVVGCTPIVEVYIPARDIDGIHTGDAVALSVDKRTGEQVTTGIVASVDSQAQIQLSTLGVEESKVRVLVAPDSGDIGVGYQVDVTFSIYSQENCLVVPRRALFLQEGVDSVWVVRDGVAHVEAVEKGVEVRGGYIVNAGLQAGDAVIVDANTRGMSAGKRIQAVS